MAGRGRGLTEAILRVAAAIVVDLLAFTIWDLARSPRQLARDVRAGLGRPRVLARGVLSFLVGLLLVVGTLGILRPLLVPADGLRLLLAWAALTALLVVQLLGRPYRTADD